MVKSARGKKIVKIISTVFFILALCGIISSIKNMTVYSQCIDKPADMLLSTSQNTYDSWFYYMFEYSNQDFTIHLGMMSGKEQLGELSVESGAVVTSHVKKRTGRAKLLFVDESTEKAAFYKEISSDTPISLPQGTYRVYVVGSWFSGKCSMNWSDATFRAK